jgi:hypothetical protein
LTSRPGSCAGAGRFREAALRAGADRARVVVRARAGDFLLEVDEVRAAMRSTVLAATAFDR